MYLGVSLWNGLELSLTCTAAAGEKHSDVVAKRMHEMLVSYWGHNRLWNRPEQTAGSAGAGAGGTRAGTGANGSRSDYPRVVDRHQAFYFQPFVPVQPAQ
jgi:hypothetical protein